MFNGDFIKFNMLPLGLMRGSGSSKAEEATAPSGLIIWGQEFPLLTFL